MQFAGNGDIRGYAKKHNGIKEDLICKWFLQSNSGLYHLHEVLFTTHRDIKMDNVLLDQDWTAVRMITCIWKNFDYNIFFYLETFWFWFC